MVVTCEGCESSCATSIKKATKLWKLGFTEQVGMVNSSAVAVRALSTTVATDSFADVERDGPLVEYERRIAAGDLLDGDDFQLGTLQVLSLYDQLVEHEETCGLDRYKSSEKTGRSRWFWSRFIPQSLHSPVKGLYLYGGVGTGKTMLMDLFYDQLPSNWRKKRIHFHDLMLNVHSRLQMHKGVSDPLEVVAGEIADESMLLCLDEFMILVCTSNRTSNRVPDQLYEGGLQRDLFLPFIDTLKDRCVVHAIGSSTDYRKMTSTSDNIVEL